MTALRITLLLVGVLGAVSRPARLPAWVLPLLAAVIDLASGAYSVGAARAAVDPLRAPIGFLLAAVPLAILLDRLGFFSSLASLLTRGRHGVGGLWVLAAVVTALLNLDASVTLLTPLYVRIARGSGRDPLALAFPPVLLACLASSVLPVSNLTNLIAASRTGADAGAFLLHLGLPSLVAVGVGWVAYRRFVLRGEGVGAGVSGSGRAWGVSGAGGTSGAGDVPGASGTSAAAGTSGAAAVPGPVGAAPVDRRALAVGGGLMGAVLVGFVGGAAVGVAPWEVALGADAALVIADRVVPGGRAPRLRVPWTSVPVGTALVALSLGVLANAAVTNLSVDRLVSGASTLDLARTAGLSALAANLFNNLPALLVSLPALGRHTTPRLWAVLLGVNMGPVLLVTGSLASLLWLATLRRLGVAVRARDFTRVGVRVGLPAAGAALCVSLALQAAGLT